MSHHVRSTWTGGVACGWPWWLPPSSHPRPRPNKGVTALLLLSIVPTPTLNQRKDNSQVIFCRRRFSLVGFNFCTARLPAKPSPSPPRTLLLTSHHHPPVLLPIMSQHALSDQQVWMEPAHRQHPTVTAWRPHRSRRPFPLLVWPLCQTPRDRPRMPLS